MKADYIENKLIENGYTIYPDAFYINFKKKI